MKGIQFTIMVAIILLVVALIVYFVWGGYISNMLGGINWSDKVLKNNVDNQEKELQSLYDSFKSNDGGFDAYETSILLAKAIEFTWRDCYNICKDERELFTGFFLKNPIDFSKDMDCDNYPISGGDKIYPNIGKIKDWCFNANAISEMLVTSWGLANTSMCTDYKLSSSEGNKQWGNYECETHFDFSGRLLYCYDFCDRSGKHIDKIDWQAGIVAKGGKYGNIRIAYDPKGEKNYEDILPFGQPFETPQIKVKEISA